MSNFIKNHFKKTSIVVEAGYVCDVTATHNRQSVVFDGISYTIKATGELFGKNVDLYIGMKSGNCEGLGEILKKYTKDDSNECGRAVIFNATYDQFEKDTYWRNEISDYTNCYIEEIPSDFDMY